MNNKVVGIVGAGTMGHGIALLFAQKGMTCVLVDSSSNALEVARSKIAQILNVAVAKKRFSEDESKNVSERIALRTDLKSCKEACLVIEAVPEVASLKKAVLTQIESVVGSDCLLASNTSCLSIDHLGQDLLYPERFLGLHFFNPAFKMPLIEIVVGKKTSTQCLQNANELAEKLGKRSIVVKNSPGFATSRLGLALGLEAIRMLESSVASAKDIDQAMKLGYGHPMGPLELTDLIGLDVRLNIAETLYTELNSPVFKPPELLKELVARGALGKKSGKGFYDYPEISDK